MKRLVVMFCLFTLMTPLVMARKKPRESSMPLELRPDKALVFVCPSSAIGVFVDDVLLGGFAARGECTFDYVEPGTHYLWSPQSRFVEPLAVSVVEWDFEPGKTYYFGVSLKTAMTWGNRRIADYHFISEVAGQDKAQAPKKPYRNVPKRFAKVFQKHLTERDPSTANNALIASRRLEQGIVRGNSAEAEGRTAAAQSYEEAARLLADAANKYDELARITRKRKRNAAMGNVFGPMLATVSAQMQAQNNMVPTPGGGQSGVGVALYTITNAKSFKELIAAYEGLANEARLEEAEYLRRLACFNRTGDDDVIASCVGEVNDEQ